MKRIQLEPWTPYDKLSLASAVMRTGDQNWNAVARATRNIFEESTKYMIEEKRPIEWFSNKQCAAQYESLLKNIGPRRKKKSDKSASEHVGESVIDIIMNVVRQECIEELKRSLASTQALYLKLHKEYEDIQSGKLDHKLEDLLEDYEAKEREKEIKMKLKFKLGEKNPEIIENNLNATNVKIEDKEIKKTVDKDSVATAEPAKTNLTTSPLLTSLLQSPSPLTRANLPSNTSPTISLLLNSSPSVPSSDSPTLTKLLESSSSVVGSPLSTGTTLTAPKPETSLTSNTNPAIVSTASSPLLTASQIPSANSSLRTPIVEPQIPLKMVTSTTQSSVSSSVGQSSTTMVATTPACTLPSTGTIPITISTTSFTEKKTVSDSTTVGDFEQVSEEVTINMDKNAENLKASDENKEFLEIEEVANPTTPEIVLEDLVHSVVESEVVIDQETPTSKRKTAARKIQLEQAEDVETDDEVMETVEQIIEKVEDAIIETVGEESADIGIALNQSSETDNLSDQIETLELDSDAVELIVLGHNQGKVITIRHDAEIISTPIKQEPVSEDDAAPDSFGEIENLVEEEVSTTDDKVQVIEETVNLVEDEEDVIKLQEEIIEHEVIVEDKEVIVQESVELLTNKAEIKEDEKIINEQSPEKIKLNEEIVSKEGPSVEVDVSVKEGANAEIKKEIIHNENNDKTEKVTDKKDNSITLESYENEKLEIDLSKDGQDAIVEEAPEEVVIAQVIEDTVSGGKEQIDNSENKQSPKALVNEQTEKTVVKHEIIDEEEEDMSVVENRSAVDDTVANEPEKKLDLPLKQEATEVEDNVVTPDPKPVIKISSTLKNKDTFRRSGGLLDLPSSSTTPIVTLRKIKLEKDVDHVKIDSKSNLELDKRRTSRKRYTACADSKPNSPAPSSHSMEDDRDYKAWKKSIMLVYNRLAAHKYASVFLKPIRENDASGYHDVVLRPIDLTTIKRNIETGVIRSTVEFQRDMILMAQNAMIYNKTDSLVFKMAEDMLADMMSQMEVMVQALGDGVPLWGDTEEKLLTRGRASKAQADENSGLKRRSQTEDSLRRRNQNEDSAKKRKSQLDDSYGKRKFEESRKRGAQNEDVKKKTVEESNVKRKSSLPEDITNKKKPQIEESNKKKSSNIEESSNTKKKTQNDDNVSSKRKIPAEDSVNIKKVLTEESPAPLKRKGQPDEQQNKRKLETPTNTNKRKIQVDETPSNKKKITEESGSSKRKAHTDETPTNKRKRSAMTEEPRSANKRKRDQ